MIACEVFYFNFFNGLRTEMTHINSTIVKIGQNCMRKWQMLSGLYQGRKGNESVSATMEKG